MNTIQISGVVMHLQLPKETEGKKNKSGTIIVRYGPKKQSRKSSLVQFVNAAVFKIPAKMADRFRKIQLGDFVEILGRVQGRYETTPMGGKTHLTVDLIANNVTPLRMEMYGYQLVPRKGEKPIKPAPTEDLDPGEETVQFSQGELDDADIPE